MSILIVVALIIFGVIFSLSYRKKYSIEADPVTKKKRIRKGFLIGFTPLIIVILYWLGWIIYFFTHVSGDL